MTTSLYRHFDAQSSLLYVGISLSWPARTKTHAREARWFDQVARVEIEQFPDRDAALVAERLAIKAEQPKFNVVHNNDRTSQAKSKKTAHIYRPGSPPEKSESWGRFMTRSQRRHVMKTDPVIKAVKGGNVTVGPALVYSEDQISIMVAHGEVGTAGELTEIILGSYLPDMDAEWTRACAAVITIQRYDGLTIDKANDLRNEIISKLKNAGKAVEAYNTDISFAVAYASTFPSEKSRQILDDVALERTVQTTTEAGLC